jgi:hypothetical protein
MPSGNYRLARATKFSADAFDTVLENNIIFGNGDPPLTGLAAKLALSDGTVRWTTPYTYAAYSPPLTLLNAAGDFVLLTAEANVVNVTPLAAADGSLQQTINLSCDAAYCAPFDAAFQADGSLRVVYDTSDAVMGSRFEIVRYGSDLDVLFHDGFELSGAGYSAP